MPGCTQLTLFKELCQVPQVESAAFIGESHASLHCSYKNFETKSKCTINLTVDLEMSRVIAQQQSETLSVPLFNTQECVTFTAQKGSDIHWTFEHWNEHRLVFSTTIGKPWLDTQFGTACWNKQKREFLFAAEEIATVTSNELVEGFGEQYSEAKRTKLFLFKAEEGRIVALNVPVGIVAVNANWVNAECVAFTAVPTTPWKLGYNFMCNQKYALVVLQLETGECTWLREALGMHALRSPIGTSDGCILFLANEHGGAHFKPSFLCRWNPLGGTVEKVLEFPLDCRNIRADFLIGECIWIEVREKALYREVWLVDTKEEKVIRKLKDIDRLFLVSPKGILYSKSTLCSFSLYWEDGTAKESQVYSFKVQLNPKISIVSQHPEYNSAVVSSMSSAPAKGLFLMTHGGPHASLSVAFSPFMSALLADGWDLALVNYPEKEVVGQIGTLDVEFVARFAEKLKPLYKKMIFYGGSHAGFIGAWITATHPNLFSHVILKNPVVNLISQYSTSDIPNWAVEECGIPFEHSPLTLQQTLKLYNHSPINKLLGVGILPVKTLLVLGAKDLRCPMHQGLEWFHALKGSGNEALCFVYPEDGHALDSFEGYVDCYEQIVKFIEA